MSTVQNCFKRIYKILHDSNIEHPHLEASWILEFFCNVSEVQRIQDPELQLKALDIQSVESAIKRRLSGEPLAYILNEKEFYGLRFYVDSAVLIPRPETELLVDWALNRVRDLKLKNLRILDLGSGSGCVGLSILKKTSGHLVGVDISEQAIEISKKNAKALNLNHQTNFFTQDASQWLAHYSRKIGVAQPKFDLIVSNPPYISREDNRVESHVRKYEPEVALFSGDSGLEHIREWLNLSTKLLSNGGAIAFEIGEGQGPKVLTLFSDQKVFSKHYAIKDYAGIDRIICGEI